MTAVRRPACTTCGHPFDAHNPALAVVGGLFAAGTRPCVVVTEVKTIRVADPHSTTTWTVDKAAWWPCSCDDYTHDPGGEDGDDLTG